MVDPPCSDLGDCATADAVGKATEALEYVERARGHLYAFHQLIGRADFLFEESALMLDAAGHRDHARSLSANLVGRDVLEGRWTFQVVEGFDNDYYDTARAEVRVLVDDLVGGQRHLHEQELRRRRREQRLAFLDTHDGDRGPGSPVTGDPTPRPATTDAVSK